MKLRKGKEIVCIEHNKLERKSAHVEVRCQELVEKLKNKLFSIVHMNQEKACFEVEGIREEIDNEFALDARDGWFEESEECKESEECVESEEMEESEKEKEHEESEESEENMNMKTKICYVYCLMDNAFLIVMH